MQAGHDHGPFLVDATWIMEGERLCSLMYSLRKTGVSSWEASSKKMAVFLVVLWMIKYMLLA